MTKLLRGLSFLVAFAVWIPLGLYLWIPSVLLGMVFYAAALLATSVFPDFDVEFSEKMLQATVEFYGKGFRRMSAAASGKNEVLDTTSDSKEWGPVDVVMLGGGWFVAATLFWALLANIVSLSQ